MWLALATITIAVAIVFSALALAIQKTDNRKDEQEEGGSFGPDEIRIMTAAFDQVLDDLRTVETRRRVLRQSRRPRGHVGCEAHY